MPAPPIGVLTPTPAPQPARANPEARVSTARITLVYRISSVSYELGLLVQTHARYKVLLTLLLVFSSFCQLIHGDLGIRVPALVPFLDSSPSFGFVAGGSIHPFVGELHALGLVTLSLGLGFGAALEVLSL